MIYDFSFLEDIYKKLKNYEIKIHNEGTDINILQIAGKEHSEVVICRLIAFLLNPSEKHGKKATFLNFFLQEIGETIVLGEELKSLQVICNATANLRKILI